MESKQSNIRKNYVGRSLARISKKEERKLKTMKQKTNNDVLSSLTAAKKRIDKQRAELTKELTKLEKELQAEGNPYGKAISFDALLNGTYTAEEINRRITNIKAALALPYYADSEYRRLSVEYLKAFTETEAENLESNEKEIEAAIKTIEETQERLEQLRKDRQDIVAAAAELLWGVGLNEASNWCMDYTLAYVYQKYTDLVKKYD